MSLVYTQTARSRAPPLSAPPFPTLPRPSPCFLAPLPGLCSIAYSNLNLIFLPTFTVLRL